MLAAALSAVVALAAAPAAPARWAEDHAGLISEAARDRIDRRLEGYEQATGHQVVLWIGDTLDGADLADWSTRTFAAWKLGREGHDDGVAIFVLAQDHELDIEVGYGLEGALTDLTAKRIIDEVIAPKLRSGDADEGIALGVDAVLAAIEGQPWEGPNAPAAAKSEQPSTTDLWMGGIMLVLFLLFAIRHPRLALAMLMLGGRRGGGGGGGSGGFGGGGGRSGGGGGRGGW